MNERIVPNNQRMADEERSPNEGSPRARNGASANSSTDRFEQPSSVGGQPTPSNKVWRDAMGNAGDRGDGNGNGGDRRVPSPLPRSQRVAEAREVLPQTFAPESAYAAPRVEEVGIDLRKYLWLLFKHRWLILGSAGVFFCVGLAVTFLTTPVYRASTTVQIKRDVPNITDVQSLDPVAQSNNDAEFYQTQYELLQSHSLAERVVTDLGLQDDPAFLAVGNSSTLLRLRGWLFGKGPDTTSAAADIAARQRSAADRLLANLKVEPVRNSSIVRLSYDSPNRKLAQAIANAVANAYITLSLERRYDASTYARTFLQDRLQELKQKLEDSEKQVVSYAEAQHIVGDGQKQTMAQSNLEAANQDLAKAATDRLRAELLWQQVKSTDGLGLPQILDDKTIQALRATRADLANQYQNKLSFFKPAYPELKQLKAQIDSLDRQIQTEVGLVKDSIKAQYDDAVSAEQSLSEQVEKLKADVTDFQKRNIEYTTLQREVDTNQQLYDGLLQRYKEIGVAGGVGTNNISVVDKAELPLAPHSPSLLRNTAVALVLGLLLGAAAAFAREQFDDTYKSPEDLEEDLGLPLLGLIPMARDPGEHAKLIQDPRSNLAEAYRSLRTALQFSTTTGMPKSLLITSARPSEGKSTTATTLARNFAELGMRVLLIDADLRRPSIHHNLGIANAAGLANCLTGAALPPDVFQKTTVSGLTVLTSGPLPPNPAELLAGARMLSLLTVATAKFDIVIVDGPPVGGLADAPLLASVTIGTLLVINGAETRRGVAKAALKRLHFARAQMVGALINKVDMRHQNYGYGYGYGSVYGDTGYYGEEAPALAEPSRPWSGLLGRLTGR